jgi:hypothetical protein
MVRSFLALLLGAVGGSAAASVACVLVSQGPAHIATPDGRAISLPSRQSDCSGIKVVSGSVAACFLDVKGSRQCRTLGAGDEFVASKMGAAASETGAFKATVTAFLRGDSQVVAGQTRTGQRPQGFPYGNLVALSGGIPLSPQLSLGSFSTGSLSVRAIGQPVSEYQWSLQSETVSIPAGQLEPGREYAWTATAGGRKFNGRFRMASAGEAQRVRDEIRALVERESGDELTRSILTAELLAEKGFLYEAAFALKSFLPDR